MLSPTLLSEANRQLTICNACRYCEGICPVFPALERRRTFLEQDVVFLANLCHDCGACLDACPYSPPHELAVDVPKLMSTVRLETYEHYAFPKALGMAFRRGPELFVGVTAASVVALLFVVTIFSESRYFGSIVGPGSFYRVVPWFVMFSVGMLLTAYGVAVMSVGLYHFWRDTDGPLSDKLSPRSMTAAVADVLVMREMRGGGPGCPYPDEHPSHHRLLLHQAVLFGFGLTFLSTTLAAFAQEILGILPPYDLLSPVVISGTVGGVLQVVGCIGLIIMKFRVRRADPTATRSLDLAFLVALLLANATGLALLALRETPVMGPLLVVHLAFIYGLFVLIPYGKFVHAIYRYAALVRNRIELKREDSDRARRLDRA